MTEEEKKAIEDLNNLIEPFKNKDNSMTYKKEDLWSYLKYEDYKAIDILLNLIDKQQKEIEQLKKPRYIYNAKSGEVTKLESNEETIKLQTENKKLKQLLAHCFEEGLIGE